MGFYCAAQERGKREREREAVINSILQGRTPLSTGGKKREKEEEGVTYLPTYLPGLPTWVAWFGKGRKEEEVEGMTKANEKQPPLNGET